MSKLGVSKMSNSYEDIQTRVVKTKDLFAQLKLMREILK